MEISKCRMLYDDARFTRKIYIGNFIPIERERNIILKIIEFSRNTYEITLKSWLFFSNSLLWHNHISLKLLFVSDFSIVFRKIGIWLADISLTTDSIKYITCFQALHYIWEYIHQSFFSFLIEYSGFFICMRKFLNQLLHMSLDILLLALIHFFYFIWTCCHIFFSFSS